MKLKKIPNEKINQSQKKKKKNNEHQIWNEKKWRCKIEKREKSQKLS